MKFNKLSLACLVVSGSALLTACGGSSDTLPVLDQCGKPTDTSPASPTLVALKDTPLTITANTQAALIGSVLDKSFVFSAGIPVLGTASSTSLKFSGTAAAPTFSISASEGTASGTMGGACTFTLNQSTFTTGPLAQKSLTVDICQLTVGTAGIKADGSTSSAPFTLGLGAAKSISVSLPISISRTGDVSVNCAVIGKVPVGAATGAGS